MLDFGSSYDALLAARTSRRRQEVLQYGALTMHLQADAGIDTRALRDFSSHQVLTVFGVDVGEEHELRPGIMLTTRVRGGRAAHG